MPKIKTKLGGNEQRNLKESIPVNTQNTNPTILQAY